MKILLISWLVLLLGVSLNSGHYIYSYKVEKDGAPEYEVEESPSGSVLVKKLEKLTLGDYIYNHYFDRAHVKEEPAITERAFTNSHGYQFLEKPDEPSRNDELEHDDEVNDEENEDQEESETKPLTDAAVKEAYKSRSYLFDQMRQRNDVISPDFLERKKREAEFEYLPEAPRLRYDSSEQEEYALPRRTYGMNLNSDGGYVWNNLNNPPSLFEIGQPPNGYENAGQEPSQSSEAPQPGEQGSPSATPESSDSGSSEDIYVNINRPKAQPLEDEGLSEDSDEPKEETEAKKDENGSAETPLAPIINDNSGSNEARYPIEPIVSVPEEDKQETIIPVENPEPSLESVSEPEANSQESKPVESPIEPAPVNEESTEPQPEKPTESGILVPVEEIVINNSGEGSADNSEGDTVKEVPEAPTLPPLNYDNLPDYIRQAISSTERTEQTDNPFVNPQPSPEDKNEMEDKIEEIMATAQPVEDIPKTYGMNLTSGSGQVWNDLVSPPVSYEVGSTESNQSEEPKETTTQATAVVEEQGNQESEEEPRISTTAEPEKESVTEPIAYPEENVTPIAVPEATEIPENPEPNNPDVELPETNPDEENKTNNELPQVISTTEKQDNPESNEPDIKLPEDEQSKPNTDIPEVISTTEVPASIEPDSKIPEEADNEENKPDNDNIEPVIPIEPVETTTPVQEPETPEVKEPETGSGEIEEAQKPDGEATGGTDEKVNEPDEPKPEVDADKKPDIMSELLQSDQFWKWLGEWTATYMELMEKHIRKIVIQEICKHSKQDSDMCLLDDSLEESDPIIKDGKITINGKEIDLSLNNKFDNLKRGDKGNSVGATTIYGNAVGNDKVTNVFIFNPNNAKDIIEGLKPEDDSKVNIIIEDKGNESVSGVEDRVVGEIAGVTEAVAAGDENKEAGEVKEVKSNADDKIPAEDEIADKVVEKEVSDVKPATSDSSELAVDREAPQDLKALELE